MLDETRAGDAHGYFGENAVLVAEHPGAAFAEVAILSAIFLGDPSGPSGLLGAAHLADLSRAVMSAPDRGLAYRLTHAIMFASDFGRNTLSLPVGYDGLLDTMVGAYADDLDVLGELLISARCIGYWSPAMDEGYEVFRAGWDALDRTTSGFAENYHQILVGGLLFSMEG